MKKGYFNRVAEATPTRVWVNNPARPEIEKAIEAGAISCTTNPAYCSKVMFKEPGYMKGVINEVLDEAGGAHDVAERVYQRAARSVIEAFLPLYEESKGSCGFVTMQGDPRLDTDPDAIVGEILRFRELGPNLMAKIPATKAGLKALEILVGEDIPLCATEVFSISQAVRVAEVYESAAARCGKRPPLYITHITGIFDQLFQATAKGERLEIPPAVLVQAGCIIARREYRIMNERRFPGTLLGGGARGLHHFTEMVGGDLAVTLNWSTMDELIKEDGPVVSRIDVEARECDIELLCEKLPNFRRAYEEGGLLEDEFEDFGPVVLFRTQFLNGYARLEDAIADRRLMRQGKKTRETRRETDC